jgi:hypothetical protein
MRTRALQYQGWKGQREQSRFEDPENDMATEFLNTNHYAHRPNYDGTLDSVCKLCYLTVARAYRETDLIHLEVRHICQPVERRRSTRIAHRVFDNVGAGRGSE